VVLGFESVESLIGGNEGAIVRQQEDFDHSDNEAHSDDDLRAVCLVRAIANSLDDNGR
jgi:hypothetical protein